MWLLVANANVAARRKGNAEPSKCLLTHALLDAKPPMDAWPSTTGQTVVAILLGMGRKAWQRKPRLSRLLGQSAS
jgi:hypothetical protein